MSEPTRPEYLKVHPEHIPDQLTTLPQWVTWRAVWQDARGKWTKVPHQPDGRKAKSTDPATWAEFGECLEAYQVRGFDGIGFVFTEEAGIIGVDLDHCIDAGGNVAPWAQQAVDTLNSYAEMSPSGDGLHVFVFGTFPGDMTGRRKGGVEVYAEGRYLTVTGHVLCEVQP